MDEIIIFHYNYLSSPLCDISDVKETLANMDVDENIMEKIEYVKKFLESLLQERKEVGTTISIVVDQKKLSDCISKLSEVEIELEDDVMNEPKDNEGSDISVEDCIQDVLYFLKSLAKERKI